METDPWIRPPKRIKTLPVKQTEVVNNSRLDPYILLSISYHPQLIYIRSTLQIWIKPLNTLWPVVRLRQNFHFPVTWFSYFLCISRVQFPLFSRFFFFNHPFNSFATMAMSKILQTVHVTLTSPTFLSLATFFHCTSYFATSCKEPRNITTQLQYLACASISTFFPHQFCPSLHLQERKTNLVAARPKSTRI